MIRAARRMAAIFDADVVDDFGVTGKHEGSWAARLAQHRVERLEPAVAHHGGRLVELADDGARAEFPAPPRRLARPSSSSKPWPTPIAGSPRTALSSFASACVSTMRAKASRVGPNSGHRSRHGAAASWSPRHCVMPWPGGSGRASPSSAAPGWAPSSGPSTPTRSAGIRRTGRPGRPRPPGRSRRPTKEKAGADGPVRSWAACCWRSWSILRGAAAAAGARRARRAGHGRP